MIWARLLAIGVLVVQAGGCYGDQTGGDPSQVVPRLLDLLSDPSPDIRRTAVISLGRIAAPGTAPLLIPSLRDVDPRVRQWAAWALGVASREPSREIGLALADRLADPSEAVRMAAAQALREVDEHSSVTAVVVEQLQVQDDRVQSAAAFALIGREQVKLVPEVLRALHEASPSVRRALVATLGEMGDDRVVPLLRERLREDGDAGVRVEAAYRLGVVGDRGVLESLLEASTTDRDPNVRRWAAQSVQSVRSAGVPDSGPRPN